MAGGLGLSGRATPCDGPHEVDSQSLSMSNFSLTWKLKMCHYVGYMKWFCGVLYMLKHEKQSQTVFIYITEEF